MEYTRGVTPSPMEVVDKETLFMQQSVKTLRQITHAVEVLERRREYRRRRSPTGGGQKPKRKKENVLSKTHVT